jgi:hypothetical protein
MAMQCNGHSKSILVLQCMVGASGGLRDPAAEWVYKPPLFLRGLLLHTDAKHCTGVLKKAPIEDYVSKTAVDALACLAVGLGLGLKAAKNVVHGAAGVGLRLKSNMVITLCGCSEWVGRWKGIISRPAVIKIMRLAEDAPHD